MGLRGTLVALLVSLCWPLAKDVGEAWFMFRLGEFLVRTLTTMSRPIRPPEGGKCTFWRGPLRPRGLFGSMAPAP